MLVAVALAALSLTGCRRLLGWTGARPVERQLAGLGRIVVPNRLDGLTPVAAAGFVSFGFQRVYPWVIGSFAPVREAFQVTVYSGGLTEERIGELAKEFHSELRQRVEDFRWRQHGPVRVGEGILRVNSLNEPAWVLEAFDPARNLRLGYMVCHRDASLDEAIGILDTARDSFSFATDPSLFFHQLREPSAPEQHPSWYLE
jgi:hypothetical protein